MPNLTRGSFSINLGIVKLAGDLADEDRQCAWELYTELSTRVAVTGKQNDTECTNFEGELLIESLDSLYNFFKEARQIMRRFPVGKLLGRKETHLGVIISKAMSEILRPFLEKWQVDFRYWWEYQSNPRLCPLERQKEYPRKGEFLNDWSAVRYLMRAFQEEIVRVYDLVSIYSD